jgi:antitoxin component of MazEF toxin-antitoxin module
MTSRFAKWGNSVALRIPSGLAKELRVAEGTAADLRVSNGSLVVTPVRKASRYDIDKLAAAITPENRHGEIDTGRPVGNELV